MQDQAQQVARQGGGAAFGAGRCGRGVGFQFAQAFDFTLAEATGFGQAFDQLQAQ